MSTFKFNPFLRQNFDIVTPHALRIFQFGILSCITCSVQSYATETTLLQLPVIEVVAIDKDVGLLNLNQVNHTASQLALTAKETPATVQTITQQQLQENGLSTIKEVFGAITGATVGNVPGNPAVLTMRGFSGNMNTVLYDGVRQGASTFTTRDLDTWKYEKIEVLKGPSSVLYGEGALGGAVNLVTRKPNLEKQTVEGMFNYGSFNTVRAALGANVPVNERFAFRSDVSYLRSDSLYDIDHQQTTKFGFASSALYQATPDLSMLFTANFDHDNAESSYHGSPLVPASVAKNPSHILRSEDGLVIDKAIRHKNYSPNGAELSADTTSLSWTVDYALSPIWTLKNIASYYHADRTFFLAAEQNYNLATGLFDRDVEAWTHDHTVWSNRFSAASDQLIAGQYRNRFAIGAEYSYTDFDSDRPSGSLAAVDPYHPNVGQFPSKENLANWSSNNTFSTQINNVAVFAENAINITPEWIVIGGVRYENIDVDRHILSVNSGAEQKFTTKYTPFSWRVGSVYNIVPDTQLYVQYSTAVTPVSSLVVISTANGQFNLSKGKSAEIGFKSSVFDGKTEIVGSLYWITLDDILTRDPNNSSLTIQGGEQQSKGVELTASSYITPQLRANLGASWVDAQYKKFIQAGGVDRSGNQPVNVPEKTLNASLHYQMANLPITLGAFAKHASGFYTDTANTYFVKGHTTYDASLNYQLNNDISVTLWGKNLTDEFYGEYSGYSSKQIYIGAPRRVELGMNFKF